MHWQKGSRESIGCTRTPDFVTTCFGIFNIFGELGINRHNVRFYIDNFWYNDLMIQDFQAGFFEISFQNDFYILDGRSGNSGLLTVLRIFGSSIGTDIHSAGCSIWYSQISSRHILDGRDEAWTCHEVCHSSHYGWYAFLIFFSCIYDLVKIEAFTKPILWRYTVSGCLTMFGETSNRLDFWDHNLRGYVTGQ